MTFSVNKLTKTKIEIEPVVRVTKGRTAVLLPSINHDVYIKEQSWNKSTPFFRRRFLDAVF